MSMATPIGQDAPSPAPSCCSSKVQTPASAFSTNANSPASSYFDHVVNSLPPHLTGSGPVASTSHFVHSPTVASPSPLNPVVQQQQQQQPPPAPVQMGCASGAPPSSCCGNLTPQLASTSSLQSLFQPLQPQQLGQQPLHMLGLSQADLFAGYSTEAATQPVISGLYGPPPPHQAPLFLPQTQGTAACFCGDLCSCPGCPQHDPFGRKFGLAGSGQGCRCDMGKEQPGASKACCKSLQEGSAGMNLQQQQQGAANVLMQPQPQPQTQLPLTLPGGLPADNMMQLLMQAHNQSTPILWGNTLGGDVMLQPGLVTLGVSTGLPSLDAIWSGVDPNRTMNMANIMEQLPQHPFQQPSAAGPTRSRNHKRYASSQASRAASRTSPAPHTPMSHFTKDPTLGVALENGGCGAMYEGEMLEPGCGEHCTCTADCACRSGGILIEDDMQSFMPPDPAPVPSQSIAEDVMALSLAPSPASIPPQVTSNVHRASLSINTSISSPPGMINLGSIVMSPEGRLSSTSVGQSPAAFDFATFAGVDSRASPQAKYMHASSPVPSAPLMQQHQAAMPLEQVPDQFSQHFASMSQSTPFALASHSNSPNPFVIPSPPTMQHVLAHLDAPQHSLEDFVDLRDPSPALQG
ncbi:copper-binding transcription factor [Microbotryomycetes sp. JL221]|nr:copper-binding transcription factor [Microbotryomycetes sp. JL221]